MRLTEFRELVYRLGIEAHLTQVGARLSDNRSIAKLVRSGHAVVRTAS